MAIPGHPDPMTQRGNRRKQTFFEERDYARMRGVEHCCITPEPSAPISSPCACPLKFHRF